MYLFFEEDGTFKVGTILLQNGAVPIKWSF